MKKLTSLFVIGLSFLGLNAQDMCGTHMPEEYEQHLATKDRSYLYDASRDASAGVLYVPIQYHIVGKNDGSGYFPLKDLITVHCELNERYAGTDIQFYFHDDVQYHNRTAYWDYDNYSTGNAMMNEFNVSNVCNVYVVKDPRGVCGYAYFPGSGPSGGGIALNESCNDPGSTTLAHEMGHYLGLPHTFATIGGVEYVNGANCASAGDRFCDTPADFLDYRWSCPYTGNETDPNGDFYNTVLDETFYMSYSLDHCQDKFSGQQQDEMYWVLQNERPSLLTHTLPSFLEPQSTNLVFPPNNSDAVPANWVSLKWRESSDATHYHVLVGTHSSFNFGVVLDTMVSDTTMIVRGLDMNQTYRWKVKPMTLGDVCADYTTVNKFTTSELSLDVFKTDLECFGEDEGSINLAPSGGTLPYSYVWSNGLTYNPITNLEGGDYSVTITDLAGRQLMTTVRIEEPEELDVDVVYSGPVAVAADISGGVGPYSINWSDGNTGEVNPSPDMGNLTVYVTDDNGCSTQKSFTYTDIDDPTLADWGVTIFPNPLKGQDILNIEIEAPAYQNAEVVVYAADGREMLHMHEDFAKGNNLLQLNTADYASGIYMVSLQSEGFVSTKRFTILK